jgi:hypothetical protein
MVLSIAAFVDDDGQRLVGVGWEDEEEALSGTHATF